MATERGMGRKKEDEVPYAGKNYLLVIGIDAYQNWQALSNAVKDAREFAEVLTRQYQFAEDQVFALYNEEATEANIYQALRDMKRRLEPLDNLIVYYSGHGYYDNEFDEGYWVPVNAKPGDESQFISNANIVKRINALDTQHTLLIVDSCFSGSLVVRKRNAIPDERFKSRRILASGRHETVSDGREGENSPFSAGLLTFLRQNTAPKLDTTSLILYVKDYVFGKAQQHPVDGRIQNSADEGGEFVFHLRRDEATVWQEVCAANTVVEYRNYLAGFPDGVYQAVANRKINELEEDDIWKSTKINDNELAFEAYIRKYSPSGKYLAEARSRLEQLKLTRSERQKAQEEMAARENQREQQRATYDAHVKTAESLYQERKLEDAREAYRAALKLHLPGFVPNQEYLEEQINFCQTNLAFLRHYEHGKDALQSENYRLAIEYFQEALKINNNSKVEKLIAYCQDQLRQPQQKRGATKTQQQAYATPTPRRRGVGWWMLLGAVGVFVLLVIIAIIAEDTPTTTPNYSYDDPVQTDPAPEATQPVDVAAATPPPPAATTPSQMILGSWRLQAIAVVRDGYAYDATQEDPTLYALLGATYYFQNNGIVNVNTSVGASVHNYTINGYTFYLGALGYGIGEINQLDNYNLVLTLPFTNSFGTHQLQFSLSR